MLRHINFHKRCFVIYSKSGSKCLKLSAQNSLKQSYFFVPTSFFVVPKLHNFPVLLFKSMI